MYAHLHKTTQREKCLSQKFRKLARYTMRPTAASGPNRRIVVIAWSKLHLDPSQPFHITCLGTNPGGQGCTDLG
jgi:hypothetical protein